MIQLSEPLRLDPKDDNGGVIDWYIPDRFESRYLTLRADGSVYLYDAVEGEESLIFKEPLAIRIISYKKGWVRLWLCTEFSEYCQF
jgi:hypothetical protein